MSLFWQQPTLSLSVPSAFRPMTATTHEEAGYTCLQ